MLNKEELTGFIKDIELKQSLKKVLDICQQSIYSHQIKHTKFLTPNQVQMADQILQKVKDINYFAFGISSEAERKIIYFYPEYMSIEDREEVLSVVRITTMDHSQMNHRDVLGTIISLGLERENIGDILFGDQNEIYVIVLKPMDEYLVHNLNKICSEKVKVDLVSDIPSIDSKYEELNLNVASFRLDVIVSALLNMSRDKAQKLIQSGNVRLNFVETKNNSQTVPVSSVLSIRGYGKYKYIEFLSETKKNRNRIRVLKYGER